MKPWGKHVYRIGNEEKKTLTSKILMTAKASSSKKSTLSPDCCFSE